MKIPCGVYTAVVLSGLDTHSRSKRARIIHYRGIRFFETSARCAVSAGTSASARPARETARITCNSCQSARTGLHSAVVAAM